MSTAFQRMSPLAGQVAVITGAGSGIGLATARLFATCGARLALVDRERESLAALAREFPAALLLSGDVGDPAVVADHAAAVAEQCGPMDILVTAAGWSDGKSVADGDFAGWRAVLGTVLDGTYLWAQQGARAMAERGGAIVMVGSQLALAGGRSNAAYLAGKGAVMSLARSMALDHAEQGIRVNTVIPGAIETPLLARSFARSPDPAAARARSVARHPMGRLGRAEEVAQAILFLAGDTASFTTGSCVMVDGGWLAG
ncbi:SDR family oxidoreductase [Oceaniglobus roseus]|uniref:SDR family oxidoreductase n=1 Tax=Oceaniglobus roseus TaxID=1737570 RepID=UPI001C12C6BA|nr:SDR family oxidoreductase [Kandeliimicrobium roseum]